MTIAPHVTGVFTAGMTVLCRAVSHERMGVGEQCSFKKEKTG